MRAFFLDAAVVSAVAGALALLVVLLRPLLHRRYTARLRCAVWWVLALWLCLPLKFTLPQAPVRLAVPRAVAEQTVALPRPAQPVAAPGDTAHSAPAAPSASQRQGGSGASQAPADAASGAPAAQPQGQGALSGTQSSVPSQHSVQPQDVTPPQAQPPSQPDAQSPTLQLWQLAVLGWALAALAVLTARLGGYLLWRRRTLRWSRPVQDEALLALSEKAALAAKARRPAPLYWNPRAACPMAVGLLRPVLLLPEGLPADDQTAMMLVHEYTHLSRRDIALKALLVLASSLHWFNPAVWLMARAAGEDIELACDETALRGRPARWREAYSRALVAGAASPRALLATHFAAGKRNMMQRLAAVFDKKNKKKGVLVFTALVLTAALAVGLVACGVGEGLPGAEPLPEGAVAIRKEDAAALEETLWNGLLTLAPVTGRVAQSDMPLKLLFKTLDSQGRLRDGYAADLLFLDEAQQVGLAVEEGTFADMPRVRRTEDGGKTWTLADTSQAAVATPTGDYRELHLRRSLDGAVVLEYTTGTMATGGTYVYHLMSVDQGKTWQVPRRPKAVRRAAKILARYGWQGWSRSPLDSAVYKAAQDNDEYVQAQDGTVRWDSQSYYRAPKGAPIYAMTGGRVHLDAGEPGVLSQAVGYDDRDVRLVYRGLSDISVEDGAYLSAGDPLGTAGDTEYGEGLTAQLLVDGVAVPGDWLYLDYTGSDLSGWRWNAYTPPALLPLPGDMAALLRPDAPEDGLSADPTAVRLAYNFGLALLNNDASRLTELVMGQDAPDLFSLYPDTNPLADLTGFACTGAAVAVDEDGGPALLILDIEAPGKTGLPTGRHAYCLEYRTRRQVDENPNPGPAGDTVSALVPRQLWGPQNTPAQQAAGGVRLWCTYGNFESGDALARDNPERVMQYLLVQCTPGGATGSQLKELAESRLDIHDFQPPKTDHTQDAMNYWFIQSYDAATDAYTLTDGFDGGMLDVGLAVRWVEEPQPDGTLRLTRWNFRDALCMVPWVSGTYVMRENGDGSYRTLSARYEDYEALLPLDDALLESYTLSSLPTAETMAGWGTGLTGRIANTDLTPRLGRMTLENARCAQYYSGGEVQLLPEANRMEITWRPGDDVTSLAVYADGALLVRADDEDGDAAVRAGGYPQEACKTMLRCARDTIRRQYQMESVPAPMEIVPVPADIPGDQLTDAQVRQIAGALYKAACRFMGWSVGWMMDVGGQPIVYEYANSGNGYQYLCLPCLEFAAYEDYEKARDSVLARTGEDNQFLAVQQWQGKVYRAYNGGGEAFVPKPLEAIEVTDKQPGRLEVVITERQFTEEGVPPLRTPHVITIQDGNWVIDSYEGDYENSNQDEVTRARDEYFRQKDLTDMEGGGFYLYDQDFLAIWSAMGLDSPGRWWALADDEAWAASGRELLNFLEDEENRSIRWLQVESGGATARYRLREGQKNDDGSSRLVFGYQEQDGRITWYENGKRPVVNIDLGEPGDNLVDLEWTTEDKETGRRQSYFYYKEDELARKIQRTQE